VTFALYSTHLDWKKNCTVINDAVDDTDVSNNVENNGMFLAWNQRTNYKSHSDTLNTTGIQRT